MPPRKFNKGANSKSTDASSLFISFVPSSNSISVRNFILLEMEEEQIVFPCAFEIDVLLLHHPHLNIDNLLPCTHPGQQAVCQSKKN